MNIDEPRFNRRCLLNLLKHKFVLRIATFILILSNALDFGAGRHELEDLLYVDFHAVAGKTGIANRIQNLPQNHPRK